MSGVILPNGRNYFTTTAGLPLIGGQVYTYIPGTSTPKATYTTFVANVANSNPIILDSRGEAAIYWVGDYDVVLKDAAGVTIWGPERLNATENQGTTDTLRSDLALSNSASKGSGLIGFGGNIVYGQGTVGKKLLDSISVKDAGFGAIGDGVTNDAVAIGLAISFAISAGCKSVFIPAGTYLLTGSGGDGTYTNGVLIPFSTVNPDPSLGLMIYGEPGTVLKANSNGMCVLRVSRNHTTIRDITIDGNNKTNCVGVGIIPESVTQTTTQVSQQFIRLENVHRVNCTEGLLIQPGPQVGGADSGCFYIDVIGGSSNLNTRHVYSKKNVDWNTHPNHVTRANFYSQTLTRGNTGYYFEVGSECYFNACFEELINTGVTPLGTPTARYFAADCANIVFVGGYSEACSASVDLAANNLTSFGYIPASGSDSLWNTYASAYEDAVNNSRTWTPVLVSSGGGAQGASTSTGKLTKNGKIVYFTCQVSAAKGTLGAGTLSVTGLTHVADSSWAGASFQGVTVTNWDAITFTANVFTMQARITGTTIELRKLHAAGAGPAGLTLAECGATVIFEVQGWYKAA